MVAYYNEIDPFAAQWLRNLIAAGHIVPGDVDERSIEDVTPNDLAGYTQVHLFAGIGVWSHALRVSGWPDDRPVWTGSCPCQPFSAAGKRDGFADERHLWPAMFWLVRQCRPNVVFGEQVANGGGRAWLDLVSADLEGEGYAVGAASTLACGLGAPHKRQRLYWVADTKFGPPERHGHEVEDAQGSVQEKTQEQRFRPNSRDGCTNGYWKYADWVECEDGKARPIEPGSFPLAHGSSARVGRLRAYGNAIVAPQAQAFIEAYLAQTVVD